MNLSKTKRYARNKNPEEIPLAPVVAGKNIRTAAGVHKPDFFPCVYRRKTSSPHIRPEGMKGYSQG